MRYRFPSDCILFVFRGKGNIGVIMEGINLCIVWEESISNKEDEVQKGIKLDCPVVSGVLGVITRPEAEV